MKLYKIISSIILGLSLLNSLSYSRQKKNLQQLINKEIKYLDKKIKKGLSFSEKIIKLDAKLLLLNNKLVVYNSKFENLEGKINLLNNTLKNKINNLKTQLNLSDENVFENKEIKEIQSFFMNKINQILNDKLLIKYQIESINKKIEKVNNKKKKFNKKISKNNNRIKEKEKLINENNIVQKQLQENDTKQ
jgi:hypothetical protein